MPAKQRTKYGATHDRTSRLLRAHWTANPDTRCALCGLTHAEAAQLWGNDAARWEADHPDGRTDLGLRPAHSKCNRSEGASRGNREREPHTENW